MNIIQRIFSPITKTMRVPFVQSISGRYNGGFGTFKGIDEYKNFVSACIKVRANSVANIDIELVDSDGVEIEDSPINSLLDRVNPYMTRKDLFRSTQSFLDLHGNAYWYLARENNGEGEIKEIYILRPDKTAIVTEKENPLVVSGYVFKQDGGVKIPFNAKEILHFKNFNPNGNYPFPHLGVGVVETAQMAIQTDNEIRKWNFNFFKNSAKPDGILEVSGDSAIGAEEYQRLRAEWDTEHRGVENSSKPAILSGGVSWKEVTRSQSDMQFADQKILNRDEILAIFQVPKTVLGLTDSVNRATADASIYIFNLFVIKELMQNIIDTLNEFLLPEFDTTGTQTLVFESPVKEDRLEILAGYTAGINKWLTRNEIRTMEGLEPTTNGNDIMGSFNEVVVDTLPTEKKTKKNAKPMSKTKNASIAENAVDNFVGKLPVKKTYKYLEANTKDLYIQVWKANLQQSRSELKKRLVTFFENQEKEVQKNLKKELAGLEVKEFKLKAIEDIAFDMDTAVTSSVSLITPFLQDYLAKAGEQAGKLVGIDFDPNSVKADTFIKQRAMLFANQINETTNQSIVEVVQNGLDEGLTQEEISASISQVYDGAKGYRADMIARTEASASANEGAKLAYQDGGVTKWEWIVVDPLDEDCKGNEGDVVEIGSAFNDGSIQPPDPHPNCECGTLPVFEN